MEKIFKLKENGTTARTEIVAGLTTFMTMAYIIALNPNLLTNFATGTPLWNAVFMATCIASAIGMLVMAFAANKPFAMAPGMGLNSFFAVVVANIATFTGLSYEEAFPAAMCIILVEGVFFVILTLFSIREKIVEAIPFGIRIGRMPILGATATTIIFVVGGLALLTFTVREIMQARKLIAQGGEITVDGDLVTIPVVKKGTVTNESFRLPDVEYTKFDAEENEFTISLPAAHHVIRGAFFESSDAFDAFKSTFK